MDVRTPLVLLAALAGLAGPAAAKPESAKSASKRVAKTMIKLDSYRMTATVQGGMASGPEHRITQARVNNTYRSDVVGTLAKISGSQEALRIRLGKEGQGVIRQAAVWKGILSTPEGRELERLFQRPEGHFAKIRKYARLAQYLPPTDAGPSGQPGGQPGGQVDFGFDEAEGEEDDKTRAREQRESAKRDKDEELASNRIRIVAPTTEAIEQFTTIVNSGCLGGG